VNESVLKTILYSVSLAVTLWLEPGATVPPEVGDEDVLALFELELHPVTVRATAAATPRQASQRFRDCNFSTRVILPIFVLIRMP
jgi:hypothetical protein